MSERHINLEENDAAQANSINGSEVAWAKQKTGGTKLYILNFLDQGIESYDVTTAYDITTASYTTEFDFPTNGGLDWKPDGTTFYVMDGGDAISYDCTTPYDITTASQSQSYTTGELPQSFRWNNDGSKFIVVDDGDNAVYSYTCSTKYDITTASSTNTLNISGQDGDASDSGWNDDGTKLYMVGNNTTTIYSYTCSTAYDISTASFHQSKDVGSEDNLPTGIGWNNDGSKMYVTGNDNNNIYSYDMGTAYELSTATHMNTANVQAGVPMALAWN